jgi:2-polyprenyl-3-methyl-5-hydroxy-6-metoxy-1,4-benzoquinol methylase
MKQNKEKFEMYYTTENDENLRGHRNNQGIIEFLTTEKYMKQVIPQKSKILDACAGCGVYSFFLANLGHIVTAGDFVKHNVDEIKKKQNQNPVLYHIYEGSATDLSQFSDESFDVVLNMGAFYHIINKEERENSISECLRVLKTGGLFFMAYLNKFSNIIKSHEEWRDDFSSVEKLLERGYIDNDSLFYQSSPEEVENIMTKLNLTILHNIATDGLKAPIYETLNSMSLETFERYMSYHYQICEIRSLLGYSEHALVICRKLI